MSEQLAACFPQVSVPDRPPDAVTALSDATRYRDPDAEACDYARLVWHPEGNRSGVEFCTRWADLESGEQETAFLDTIDVRWLGIQGLGTALDVLGIRAYVQRDQSGRPVATALVYPPSEQFCANFNALVTAERGGNGGPPLLAEPYSDLGRPKYTYGTLRAMLKRRALPVAVGPELAAHDQLHAIAAYAVIEALPPDLTGVIDNFESILSLPVLRGAVSLPAITPEWGLATDVWQAALNMPDSRVISDTLRKIQKRVISTPQRLAGLALGGAL